MKRKRTEALDLFKADILSKFKDLSKTKVTLELDCFALVATEVQSAEKSKEEKTVITISDDEQSPPALIKRTKEEREDPDLLKEELIKLTKTYPKLQGIDAGRMIMALAVGSTDKGYLSNLFRKITTLLGIGKKLIPNLTLPELANILCDEKDHKMTGQQELKEHMQSIDLTQVALTRLLSFPICHNNPKNKATVARLITIYRNARQAALEKDALKEQVASLQRQYDQNLLRKSSDNFLSLTSAPLAAKTPARLPARQSPRPPSLDQHPLRFFAPSREILGDPAPIPTMTK